MPIQTPCVFFPSDIKEKLMIHAPGKMLIKPIIRHGVLQKLIGSESMSKNKGIGGIVDRDVNFQ